MLHFKGVEAAVRLVRADALNVEDFRAHLQQRPELRAVVRVAVGHGRSGDHVGFVPIRGCSFM